MKNNVTSERHQNNNLKAITAFAKFLGPGTSFYDIESKEQILSFLDTKAKSCEEDPDRKWIVTWNDYLHRIKNFLRWFHNEYKRKDQKVLAAPFRFSIGVADGLQNRTQDVASVKYHWTWFDENGKQY